MKYLLHNQQTERLLFRSIQQSDFNTWVEFFKDPRTSQHWVETRSTPESQCSQWYEKQWLRDKQDRGGMNALLEKSTGLLVGHAGLLVQEVDDQKELEVAYSLLPQFWNQGYASEAAQKCKNIAFEMGYASSLISIISLSNLPSQRVAIKNGMMIDKQTEYRGNPVYIFRVRNPADSKKT